MKFFIPASTGPENEQVIYSSIKKHLGQDEGVNFSDRKIMSLDWFHDGKACYAEVGKATAFNGEVVVAILYDASRRLYHVCTPNRGVLRGESILAGEDWQTSARDFEE